MKDRGRRLQSSPWALAARMCWVALGCLPLMACAPGATAPAKQRPVASPHDTSQPLADKDWGRFESKRFRLSISLPLGHAWKIDDHTNSWLVARHPAATIRAKLWRERKPMSRVQCEKRARELAPALPRILRDDVIDTQPLPNTPAPDFDTVVTVGLTQVAQQGEAVGGAAMAFGAAGRHCFAMIVTSQDAGADAAVRLAGTLEISARIVEATRWQPLAPKAGVQALP